MPNGASPGEEILVVRMAAHSRTPRAEEWIQLYLILLQQGLWNKTLSSTVEINRCELTKATNIYSDHLGVICQSTSTIQIWRELDKLAIEIDTRSVHNLSKLLAPGDEVAGLWEACYNLFSQ